MSIEAASIGQQLTAMDRRLEVSVNSSMRNAAATLKTEKQAEPAEPAGLSQERVQKIVEQIQEIASTFDRELQFRVNKELDQVVIKVIDANTDKVIKEIPSAEIQRIQLRIKEALGLLFDESI